MFIASREGRIELLVSPHDSRVECQPFSNNFQQSASTAPTEKAFVLPTLPTAGAVGVESELELTAGAKENLGYQIL